MRHGCDIAGLPFEHPARQHHAKLSSQLLDIDVLVDDALCVEQIVPAQPPTLLPSAVCFTQMFAFGQQSPLQPLNDGLLGEANFHAAFKMVWPQPRGWGQ